MKNEDKKVNVWQWLKKLFTMRRGERIRSHWSYSVGFLVCIFIVTFVSSYIDEVQKEKRINGGRPTMEQQEKELNRALNTPLNNNNNNTKELSKEQQEAEAREADGYEELEDTGADPGYPATATTSNNNVYTPERCLEYVKDYALRYQMAHDIDEAVAVRDLATEDADYRTCVNVVKQSYGYDNIDIRF